MVDNGLSVRAEQRPGGVVVLHVSGEIDLISVDQFEVALSAANSHVVVDLAAVSFIDGRGIDALVAAQERAAARGDRLSVVNANLVARRLLQVCELDSLLDLGSDAP